MGEDATSASKGMSRDCWGHWDCRALFTNASACLSLAIGRFQSLPRNSPFTHANRIAQGAGSPACATFGNRHASTVAGCRTAARSLCFPPIIVSSSSPTAPVYSPTFIAYVIRFAPRNTQRSSLQLRGFVRGSEKPKANSPTASHIRFFRIDRAFCHGAMMRMAMTTSGSRKVIRIPGRFCRMKFEATVFRNTDAQ